MIENAKENSQRVELKDRIIETASEAFTAHGIKSITMDDIAASLGISKRTLYEVFQDKESLLTQCILTYIIHSGFISGYQNRYGDNLKPPTNVYHRMTA